GRCMVVRMLNAGGRPSLIYEAMRNEVGKPTVTRKEISNLGLQINFLEENASMEALIIGMEERGYTEIFCHDSFDVIIKTVDRFINLKDCDALSLAISDYKNLAASSSNEDELYTIESQYMSLLDKQQKSAFLNKLDDILTVSGVKPSDIKVSENIIGKLILLGPKDCRLH
ncbi:18014_t:CDS:2, partial [Racocetra fulgida]